MTRAPLRPVSLQDLRRIADTLGVLRGHEVSETVMRSDRRQLRMEMADGQLLVVSVDVDDAGQPRLEVDVIRPPEEPGHQLEVHFGTA